MYANGFYVGLGLGDSSEEIRRIKAFMRHKFASYASGLADTPDFDAMMTAVVSDMQRRYVKSGALKVGAFLAGVINLATKFAMGYITRPAKQLPVLFTVEGHLSDMMAGPCAFTAKALEDQRVCRWQPVGYDNVSLPFNNKSGVDEFVRLLSDVRSFPAGTPWGMAIFSQGGIVGCKTFLEHIRPANGRLHWRLSDFRGCLAFGNPYRQNNIIADWVPDPPKPNTQGISNIRMTDTPIDIWKEVARHGDLYAENEVSIAGQHKTAVYRAVQNEWTGTDSLTEQLGEIMRDFGPETIAVFQAIASGVRFLSDMSAHGAYDLAPCIDFMHRRLTA